MKKNRVRNPIAHADGGVSEGKTFNRTVKTIPPQFPAIKPFIWSPNYQNKTAKSAKELVVKAMMLYDNRAGRIADYLAKYLVDDAVAYLSNFDLTDKRTSKVHQQMYFSYFQFAPYEYLDKSLQKVINEETIHGRTWDKNGNKKDLRRIIFNDIENDEYVFKLNEVLETVMKYQGATYNEEEKREAQEAAAEEGKQYEEDEEQEEENPPQQQINSPNYLLIGIGVLIALFLFKRSKK